MKNLLKILLLLFIVVLFSSSLINAQYIGKRWAVVEDLDDKTVYLDTTSIRSLDNQLAIWSLVVYREPQTIEPLSKMVSHVKSQYLINNITKHYSIIGALYYDERGRIIGESSNPQMAGSRDYNSKPIAEDSSLEILLEKALGFLSTGQLDGEVDEELTSPDKVAFDLSLYKDVDKQLNISDNNRDDDSSALAAGNSNAGAPLTINPKANTDIIVLKDEPDYDSSGVGDNNSSSISPYQGPVEDSYTPPSQDAQYDSSKETNVTNTIFTDGYLFCFQVSSWKQKNIAESEAQKLKEQGHNAFVVEAYIPSKRGTWYRVRIGYFNSLQETRDYKNRL